MSGGARVAVPEKSVQTAAKQLCRLRGWLFYDLSQPRATMITPGVPDLVLFTPRLIWVECKRGDGRGRLSTAQMVFRQACALAGVPYLVVTSAAELAEKVEAL